MNKQINSLQMRLFVFLKTVSGDAKANSKKERILEGTGRKGWCKFKFGHTEFEMRTRGPDGEVSKLDMHVCLWRGPGGAEPPRLGAEDHAESPAL